MMLKQSGYQTRLYYLYKAVARGDRLQKQIAKNQLNTPSTIF